MDPRTVSKAEFRSSLNRVLSRAATAQRAVRARRDALCATATTATTVSTVSAAPVSAVSAVSTAPAAPVAPAGLTVEQMLGNGDLFGPPPAQQPPFQPPTVTTREDDGGYVLVHVADLTLAGGLRALMPTRALGRLRLVAEAPPGPPQELTTMGGAFLARRAGGPRALTFALLGTATDDALEVRLGAAQLDVDRLLVAQVGGNSGNSGNGGKSRLSRRRISCLGLLTLPLYAAMDGGCGGGGCGGLLIGALEVCVLFGGAPLLSYEQALRARPLAHLDFDGYVRGASTTDVGVGCALETAEDRARYRDEQLQQQRTLQRPVVEARLRRGELARVAVLTCLVRVSRVYLRLDGRAPAAPLESVYVVATLQPTAELAAVVGYRGDDAPTLETRLRTPGTSVAAALVPFGACAAAETVFCADAQLTIARRIPLTAPHVAYLRRGRASVSVFGFPRGGGRRKVFVGAVALPLVECYAAGVVLGGWFALANGVHDGFVYADVALANDGAQDDWTVAEAPPPPTLAPPAFATLGATDATVPFVTMPGDGKKVTGVTEAGKVPLLEPDETVHERLNAIVDDLATVLTALEGV